MSNVEINLSYTDSNGNLDASTLTAVNALIGQGGGGSGLAGITIASAHGMAGNGTTDDGPALSTLANTTLSGSGTIYLDPGKVFRIATPTTIPFGVTIWATQGAILQPDGVSLTIHGALKAGLWQIFNPVNGGQVIFSTTNDEAGNKRVLATPEIYPEWWGATADNAHDDTAAINAAITATTGLPTTTTSVVREAGPPVKFSAGTYRLTDSVQALDVVGLRLVGAGQWNTFLVFDAGELGTATSATSNTLVNSAKSWATNVWGTGRWQVYIYGGTGAGQWRDISSNTGTTLTVSSNWATTPDNTSTYAIAIKAVLDLDGFFSGQVSDLQVFGLNGYWRHGVKYYRNSTSSVRGSSQGRFTNVSVIQGYLDTGWQFGSSDSANESGWQADLADLVGCQAFGLGAATGLYSSQIGWRFGDGSFDNALNYTCLGCESLGNKYNVMVSATNVAWYGGTIQSGLGSDIYINNGVQGYCVFDGFRSEGSRMLLDSVSAQGVAWNVTVRNVEFALDQFKGNRWVSWRCGSGNLSIENVRTISPTLVTGTASAGGSTTLTDSTKSFDTTTYTYVDGQTAVGLAGWDIQITAGTGNGQRRQITSNTATQITVPAWTVAPDATSRYQIMARTPIVTEPLGISRLKLTNVLLTGVPINQAVQTGPAGGTWSATLEGYGELDANGSLIMGGGSMQNGTIYLSSGKNVAPYVGWGGPGGGIIDTFLYRSAPGTVGAMTLRAVELNVTAIGTTPAAVAQAVLTTGSTTYNYKLVAVDGAGNKALPSATFSATTGAATLSPSAAVLISFSGGAVPPPASSFDILKDDGTGTFKALALGVPWWHLQSFYDVGQPLTAYTAPVTDATGSLTVDGAVTIPDGSISERAVAPNVWPSAVNSGTTQTATWTQVNQKFLYTATGNCTYTIAGIPNGGSMLVAINSGAGSFTATFAAGAGLGSLRWDGGSAPVLTTTASKYDTFLFEYNGVYLAGRVVGQAA